MSIIARLGAVLGLDTKEFVKGVDAAQQKSKEFKKQLKETQQTIDGLKTAFAAASAAFVAFAAAAVHAADQVVDLADANETTIGKVLELKYALVTSGGDISKLGQFYSSFTKAIDGAAQGSDALRDSFAAVGVSIKDIARLSQDELQNKTLRGLAQIDDQVRRNSLAFELFGKAAKNVNFQAMAGSVDQAAGAYDKQAEAIRAASDAVGKLELLFGDMQLAALTAIKPVTDLISQIPAESRVEAMTKAFQALGIAIGVAFGVTAVKGVMQLAAALRVLTVTNPWLLGLAAAGGAAAYFGMDKLFGGEGEEIKPEADNGTAATGAKRRDIEMSQRDKMIQKYKTELEILRQVFKLKSDNLQAETEQQAKLLQLESEKAQISTYEYNLRLLGLEAEQIHIDRVKEYAAEVQNARQELMKAPAEEQALAKKNYDEKIKLLSNLESQQYAADIRLENMRLANYDREVERQNSWAAGWDQAFKRYTETAEKASLRGEAAFQSVMSNMESSLRTFVETGKLNFKDFVGSVVKDLLYMEMKAQATMIFRQIWGSFTDMLGPGTIGANIGSTPKRASGGYVDRPSIVGENGAELFIPRTPGTIIPNGSWQQMMGGGGGLTVNGNYIANMSAIDTQSATQFLASNKQTIWAAYQSANRMVPISR
jgi:lambda family phage tail tape measure protein